ncbi:MAG TPA: acetyl/propionyl/methylcrotonyl-CoA carboxylase subunit alpha [Stellaceae bacterium]|nr:acetyl/propionyl/methylcrotonyl-CoA carboxylase subunit alpha [Stellaceae bacterium]
MFAKILIANRGEIACRVVRTARRMGVKTVAVYSEADAEALHVRMADEAVPIGPPPAAESYLRIDRIIAACKQTGAEAVHPGYGFLSERPAFAEALAKEGIVFIGPTPAAIAAMGDKIESKKLAAAASVSTVPGFLGVIEDPGEAARIAHEIGYPVMIKASAGGGGKGMRTAHNDAELHEGFSGAQHEAKASFGDDRVFLEKYIEEPRHIEIQVLGDAHGNVVHLGERECSIQRRHQKVIEECPSPFLDAATRAAMGAQAVALAKAVDYRSAGTVEFIVDRNKNFYFLEMNTRLQVEHPVTELVAGVDLVELMIRVAGGEKLPFTQDDIRQKGWAIEARVYAEDPERNFLPSIGRLVRYIAPATMDEGGDGIRIDTGVGEGAEISIYYDPMIAKLCAYGADRNDAIARLRAALDGFYVSGLRHNITFLNAIIGKERFAEGRLSTNFIAEEFPDGFGGPAEFVEADDILLLAAALADRRLAEREGAPAASEISVLLDRAPYEMTLRPEPGGYAIERDGQSCLAASDWEPGQKLLRLRLENHVATVQIDRLPGRAFRLSHGGVIRRAQVLHRRAAALLQMMPAKVAADTSRLVLSPMPGLLSALAVEEGQEVKAGEALAIVEAMKMENVLRAERDGTIGKLRAKAGDSLAVDQVILEFA